MELGLASTYFRIELPILLFIAKIGSQIPVASLVLPDCARPNKLDIKRRPAKRSY